jgi:Raf kinase inhibitor-like YbhB/YbcL family protein
MKKIVVFLIICFFLITALLLFVFLDTQYSLDKATAGDIVSELEDRPIMLITSSAFKEGESIPRKYTCDGDNTNPPLFLENIPQETKSLAITMYDPDVPKELRSDGNWDHWIVYNIDPKIPEIPENAAVIGQFLKNTSGTTSYVGPCPPTEYEPRTHRYIFTAYALAESFKLTDSTTRSEFEAIIQNSIIDIAELTGVYQRIE